MERVTKLSSEKAVVIFTTSNCPMSHSVTSLFSSLGVGAAVHELDKDPRGRDMEPVASRVPGPGRGRRGPRAGQGPTRPRHGARPRQTPWAYAARPGSLHRRQARRLHRQGHVLASQREARGHAQGRRSHVALTVGATSVHPSFGNFRTSPWKHVSASLNTSRENFACTGYWAGRHMSIA
uniref:Glutaredoxin-C15 n=1 Tax=Aegilops tauschii TaxID=37682 RepID=M8BTS9_AEGTA